MPYMRLICRDSPPPSMRGARISVIECVGLVVLAVRGRLITVTVCAVHYVYIPLLASPSV